MPPNDEVNFSLEWSRNVGDKLNSTSGKWIGKTKSNVRAPDPFVRSFYHPFPNQEAPILTRLTVILCHGYLFLWGLIIEWLRIGITSTRQERPEQKDFAPLHDHFDSLFTNNIYRMASDVLNRPIIGVPGAEVVIKERYSEDHGWTYKYTGKERKVINMGSYNYLGMSDKQGPCAEAAALAIEEKGLGSCAMGQEAGMCPMQRKLEELIAEFLGVEEAICFPMGFGTNTMVLPAIANSDTLALSDELNHSSIVLGLRIARATVKVFPHNDMEKLEKLLRESIIERHMNGLPPYKKILIVAEGIFSMEGSICDLPRLLQIKKKYKCYLYLDEAHSFGALGPTGRGITEYWNVDPHEIDGLMGTITKSFAGSGGYVAGRKMFIDHLRSHTAGPIYAPQMSPPIIAQVLTSLQLAMTPIGLQRSAQLLRNTRYFRRRLRQMGFIVYGHDDSAVIPVLGFSMPRVVLFGREALKHGVAVVSVGFPATPMNKARGRFCVSASHTKDQLEKALEVANMCGDLAGMKFGKTREESVVY
ncbi:Aminotransferase domain containing protein [Aphelenchoides besseyi]|nr:Aminotransferase domain containing protein [Aphelenchoides besseyi]